MSIIDKPSDYFNTVLWTGDGTSGRNITGVGFQPDWVWIKNRDNGARYHTLNDSVRGVNKQLFSNRTNAEETDTEQLQAFISDGFTVGNNANTNENTSGFVSWSWLAGGTASSNTDGSITSSVSANQDAGFSIVSYTGTGANATVGHGLGVKPSMFIVKRRNAIEDFAVYHQSMTASYYLNLNTTAAQDTNNRWNGEPTTSVLNFQTHAAVNGSSDTYIAYCFADTSMSKMGSYTGNGSASSGTFIYTGFKPAFVMLKSSSSGSVGWITHDNKRIGFNPNNYYVEPNNSNAESADTDKILFLSNGFKLTSTSASWNASGGSYIYMCFAENPFVTSTGVCATAR